MKIGTKSLLFGAHQFLVHPATVFLAAVVMEKRIPNWKECTCIFIHDWGYWGCPNMEGVEGQKHPEYAANLARKYLDVNDDTIAPKDTYHNLCLYHSRSYSAHWCTFPSKLCWWDKLCVKFDPWWFYLPRVYLSGEIHEYRKEAENAGLITKSMTDREWYEWARERMIRKAYDRDFRPTYTKGS
jgi:hypothetical protein